MATEKKGLLSSLKQAFHRKRSDGGGKGSSITDLGSGDPESGIEAHEQELIKAVKEDDLLLPVPQGKAGKGYINSEVFGVEPQEEDVEHSGQLLQGKRALMVQVSKKHLQAFDETDGVLMVSPFLPEGLKNCKWKMSEFAVVESLYSTKTSKVFHVVHQESKIELALKCYSKSNMIDLQKIQAVREIWFHSHLTHPNIISMFAAWIEKGKICLAIEYAPIGSAFRKLRKLGSFPEAVSAKYIIFKNLCALQFLHEIGLIHRDIKPENILLTADGCKLADLGLVINHREEVANTCLGTFDYMAPELFSLPRKTHPMQFKNDPDAKTCDEKVDVWAIGVLVYELVYGQAPFACKVPMQTVNLIIKGFSGKFPEVPEGKGLSAEGKDFCLKALALNPADRPSVKELLCHPWISMHCKQPAATADKLGAMSLQKISGREEQWTTLLKAMGTSQNLELKHSNSNGVKEALATLDQVPPASSQL